MQFLIGAADRIYALVDTIEGHARFDDTPVECITQAHKNPVWCVIEAT